MSNRAISPKTYDPATAADNITKGSKIQTSAGLPARRGASAEGVVEERENLWPDLAGAFFVQRAQCVVRPHERVAGARVHSEADVFAQCAQLLLERGRRIGAEEVVVLGHVSPDLRGKLGPIRFGRALRESVERHGRLDLVRPLCGNDERKH